MNAVTIPTSPKSFGPNSRASTTRAPARSARLATCAAQSRRPAANGLFLQILHDQLSFAPCGLRRAMLPHRSGFKLPVGYFKRSQRGTMPQYHTSADNLSFIPAKALTWNLLSLISRLVGKRGLRIFAVA